jgi:hypothetical protein
MKNQGKRHYKGLNDAQVIETRWKYGENALTPPPKSPILQHRQRQKHAVASALRHRHAHSLSVAH